MVIVIWLPFKADLQGEHLKHIIFLYDEPRRVRGRSLRMCPTQRLTG